MTAPVNDASKARARAREINKLYAYPLPILFSPHESPGNIANVGLFPSWRIQIENPQCQGIFDHNTLSVWIVNENDTVILWRRGFFGKGSLSRSEPSWLTRRIHDLRQKANKGLTAEEVTAKRRAERQRFKLDRAQALASSVAEAEAAFAAGDLNAKIAPLTHEAVANFVAQRSKSETPDLSNPIPLETPPQEAEEDDALEKITENLEHLQLTLPEAFFLIWALDCLYLLDSETGKNMSLLQIWTMFQNVHYPPPRPLEISSRFDNPFIVHYILYHHYRSLGWVVRTGLKFCVDYLLYKRGPVFHHAEFAVVLCPVYEDEEDRVGSPFKLANVEPFSWSWLSTISRVNTQVQKTLILTYVTIPSSKRISPKLLSSPACLAHYSIREVVLRRFVPARMRD